MKRHRGHESVGIRELKNRLSEYVREVRSGEAVLVTDRGEVVAELIPPGPGDEKGVPAVLLMLARRGHLTLGISNDAAVYPKLPRLLKRRGAGELLTIHLASALVVRSTVPGVELLSLDERIRRTGRELGFRLQPKCGR